MNFAVDALEPEHPGKSGREPRQATSRHLDDDVCGLPEGHHDADLHSFAES